MSNYSEYFDFTVGWQKVLLTSINSTPPSEAKTASLETSYFQVKDKIIKGYKIKYGDFKVIFGGKLDKMTPEEKAKVQILARFGIHQERLNFGMAFYAIDGNGDNMRNQDDKDPTNDEFLIPSVDDAITTQISVVEGERVSSNRNGQIDSLSAKDWMNAWYERSKGKIERNWFGIEMMQPESEQILRGYTYRYAEIEAAMEGKSDEDYISFGFALHYINLTVQDLTFGLVTFGESGTAKVQNSSNLEYFDMSLPCPPGCPKNR